MQSGVKSYLSNLKNPNRGGGSRHENQVLRVVTAIAAFCIVIIHCNLTGTYGNFATALSRFAVPYFFMVSGYFLFSEKGYLQRLPNKIWNTIKLIILLKGIFLIIDLVLFTYGTFDLSTLLYRFVISSHYNQHVWFLYALLALYVFCYFAAKHNYNLAKLIPVSIAILLIDLTFTEFLPIAGLDTIEIGSKIYPFIGISFFVIGYYLHQNSEQIVSKISDDKL